MINWYKNKIYFVDAWAPMIENLVLSSPETKDWLDLCVRCIMYFEVLNMVA